MMKIPIHNLLVPKLVRWMWVPQMWVPQRASPNSHSLVFLTPEDEDWAAINETDVEVQDQEQAGKWKAAVEKKAAREAGLTWHEKALADLEGSSVSYRRFYSGWKTGYKGHENKKRQRQDSDEERSLKRRK